MSRSETEEIKKPENIAKMFLTWSGSLGGFNHWDKEKQVKVHVDIPMHFTVLDTLTTIKGYSDKSGSGFWSNEVKDMAKDILIVCTKDPKDPQKKKVMEVARGTYTEIKDKLKAMGAKYCQSVYVNLTSQVTPVIANLQLTGSSLSSWIDFGKANDIYKGAIEINGMTDGKKGVTVYKIPTYSAVSISKEEEAQAIEADKILKAYLKEYFEYIEKSTSTE